MFTATRIPDQVTFRSHRPCQRCGIVREARASSPLCRDCLDTVRAERKAHVWVGA